MPAARFQTTNWSLIFAADGSPDALNDLCARYWPPVYAYVRRCGVDRALQALREAGEPEHLMPFLSGEESYASLAAERGTSEGALRVAVHRLRRRFRDHLRRIVAETVEPEDVDDEIRFLIGAVSRRS